MFDGLLNAVAFAVMVIVLTLFACTLAYGSVLAWL